MKISILDQFAADAINAPAAVTGGSGKKKSSKKSRKSSKKSKKSKKSKSSKKSHSHGGNCGCPPPPVCKK